MLIIHLTISDTGSVVCMITVNSCSIRCKIYELSTTCLININKEQSVSHSGSYVNDTN